MQIIDNVLRDINSCEEIYLIDLDTQVKVTVYCTSDLVVLIRDELTINDLKRSKGKIPYIKKEKNTLEQIKKSLEKIANIEKQARKQNVKFFLGDKECII